MSKNNNITIKSGGTDKFKTEWVNKEGVFKTPQNKFIVRIKVGRNRTTIGQYNTKEEADLVYKNFIEKETFESYLQRLKDRCTEDDYKYTDEDFEKYKDYIRDCWLTNLSVYKCLEFMYFETES